MDAVCEEGAAPERCFAYSKKLTKLALAYALVYAEAEVPPKPPPAKPAWTPSIGANPVSEKACDCVRPKDYKEALLCEGEESGWSLDPTPRCR